MCDEKYLSLFSAIVDLGVERDVNTKWDLFRDNGKQDAKRDKQNAELTQG